MSTRQKVATILVTIISAYLVGAADITQFTVSNNTGIARVNEPVTSGVPLPRSLNITSVANLRIVDGGGTAIPAQFTVTARWGGAPSDATKAIKWMLIDFQVASLAANQSINYTLQDSGLQPAMPALTVTDGADSITIDTGTANFAISKTNGRLTCPRTSEPIYFQATGTDGTIYTTTGAVTASISMNGPMRASIKVKGSYQTAGGVKLLDYTTWFYFYAGQSYLKVFHTVENNTPSPIDGFGQISSADIGSAGSVSFRDVTMIVPTTHSGAVNYSIGGDSEYTGVMGAETLKLYQDSSGTDYWNKYITMTDFSGRPLSCHPRMQSYVSFRGYRITSGDTTLSAGNQAQGWLSITDESSDIWTVAIRDFWQNFPKAIRMTSANQIQVALFPDEYGSSQLYNYNLRCGEHKTHEILLYPCNGSTSIHRTFSSPLFAKASAAWYIGSGAIWRMTYRNSAEWPDYEKNIDYQLTTSPDYDETTMNWFANIYDCIQKTDFYGFLDYGDVPIDYESYGLSPMCLKYNMDYGMWMQWMRGADSRYFSLAEAAGRHIADIDVMHTLHNPRHWSDGISFQHSYHDEEGFLNPHRNYGGIGTDLISGTPGLLTCYYMTGYEKAYEAALEIADCVEYRLANDLHIQSTGMYPESSGEGFALMEWVPGLYAGNDRPSGSMLAILVPAYNATADPRYLKAMDALVDWADPAVQPYINGPNGGSGENDYINGNMLSYFCKGLGWYAEMLVEFGRADIYNAKNNLVAYQNFLMTYVWVPQEDLGWGERGGYPYRWYFNNSPLNKRDIDTSNWMLLSADTNTLAYLYSGNPAFWARAQVCFREGARDPFFPGDANTYTATKEMTNTLNYGNVFISQWNQNSRALFVSISPSSINENGGTAIGTVTRPGSTAEQLLVTLASSDNTEATVPLNVIIPAGSASATFTVTAVDDVLADGNVIVTITASANGFDEGVAGIITILDDELLTVTLNPSSISENGGSSTGTVSIPANAPSDITVNLSSSDTTEAIVPETATILAGTASANFAVTAVNDDAADGKQKVIITASAEGYTNGTGTIVVTDDDSVDVNMTFGSVLALETALVGNDVNGNPFGDANFTEAPKVFTLYFDPIKDPQNQRQRTARMKVEFNKASPASANCTWKQKICLYNKKKILKTQTAEIYIPNAQEENLVMDLWVSSINSEGNSGPFAAGRITLLPPKITGIFSDAGYTTRIQSANAGAIIYIEGNWFGAKAPKVWIEYQTTKKSVTHVNTKACKVLKPYNFERSATGLSRMALELPKSLPKNWDSVSATAHNIVIDNGIGRATFVFDVNPFP